MADRDPFEDAAERRRRKHRAPHGAVAVGGYWGNSSCGCGGMCGCDSGPSQDDDHMSVTQFGGYLGDGASAVSGEAGGV